MKKIITLDSMSNIIREEAIYVFLDDRGLTRIVSTQGISLSEVFEFKRLCWSMRVVRFRKSCFEYGIIHPNQVSKEQLLYKDSITRDIFLSKLKEWYPDDLEFFLWHPEVLEGKWNKE